MTTRSIEVFKSVTESQQKFDYFLLGLTTALFAYVGEKFSPQAFSFSPNTCELLALMFFLISIFASIKRLTLDIEIKINNFTQLHLSEKRGAIKEALATPGPKINVESGDMLDPEMAALEVEFIEEHIPKVEKQMQKGQDWSGTASLIRNWSLSIGLILLGFSKLLGVFSA